jgi:hypothetical protein
LIRPFERLRHGLVVIVDKSQLFGLQVRHAGERDVSELRIQEFIRGLKIIHVPFVSCDKRGI